MTLRTCQWLILAQACAVWFLVLGPDAFDLLWLQTTAMGAGGALLGWLLAWATDPAEPPYQLAAWLVTYYLMQVEFDAVQASFLAMQWNPEEGT